MNRAIMCLQLANAVKNKQQVKIQLHSLVMPDYLNKPAFELGRYKVTIRAANRRWYSQKDNPHFQPTLIINPTKVTKKYVVFDKIEADLPIWAAKLLALVDWVKLTNILNDSKMIYLDKIETMEVIKGVNLNLEIING